MALTDQDRQLSQRVVRALYVASGARTQEEWAAQLGVPRPEQVSDWMRGAHTPSARHLFKMIALADPDWLSEAESPGPQTLSQAALRRAAREARSIAESAEALVDALARARPRATGGSAAER